MSAVLVTGASRGVGRAVAEALVARGTPVVGVARDASRLEAVAAALGPRFRPEVLDLATDDGRARAVALVPTLGPLAGFVHAAGVASHRPLAEVTEADFHAAFAVHVLPAFAIARAIAAASPTAAHVFVTSTLVRRPAPGTLAYAAAKGALEALGLSLACELAPMGRVNLLDLGLVDTDMLRADRGDGLDHATRLDALAALPPLRRLLEPAEVAATVLSMLDAPGMTGARVTLDAGLSIG